MSPKIFQFLIFYPLHLSAQLQIPMACWPIYYFNQLRLTRIDVQPSGALSFWSPTANDFYPIWCSPSDGRTSLDEYQLDDNHSLLKIQFGENITLVKIQLVDTHMLMNFIFSFLFLYKILHKMSPKSLIKGQYSPKRD